MDTAMDRGYVLHQRPYRESSLLVNLLVEDKGRVDVVAYRGKGKSSIKGILQPFQPLLLTLGGRQELQRLTQVEAAAPALPLKALSLYGGIYLNELLMRCLQKQPITVELFHCYHSVLVSLCGQFCQSQLRYLELALLNELGTMPSLVNDVVNKPIIAEQSYQLLSQQGFMALNQNEGGDLLRVTQPQTLFRGEMLQALESHQLSAEQFISAKKLMRALLSPLLGHKPLRSRQLFSYQMQRQRGKVARLG